MALIGTTKIELTDVNTGEVETVEEHNMVTNALSEVFKVVPWRSKAVDSFHYSNYSYLTDFLGGILLFDNTIDEDVNTIYAPGGVKMVGNGAYKMANATENNTRGSYNSDESAIDYAGKTAKFVYDFGTSQANGTISTVCLTSRIGGVLGYGMDSIDTPMILDTATLSCKKSTVMMTNNSDSRTTYYNFILYADSDWVYMTDIEEDGETNSVIKRPMGARTLSVFSNDYEYGDNTYWAEKVGTFKASSVLASNKSCTYLNTDVKSHKAYFVLTSSMKIVEVDYTNASIKEYSVSGLTGSRYVSSGCVYDGYLYYQQNGTGSVYKVQLSNITNVTKLEGNLDAYIILSSAVYLNGWILCGPFSDKNVYAFIDTVANKCYASEMSITCNYTSQSSLLGTNFFNDECKVANIRIGNNNSYGYGASLYQTQFIPNYLATINNLSSPVVKTADKTMKITYTIREE